MKKIKLNIGDVFMFIAIFTKILICLEEGYVSTYNATWLTILICFEIFFFLLNRMKIKEGDLSN